MLEKKLLEELNRFKSINRNASNLNEQELPAPPPPADPAAALPTAPEETPAADLSAPPADTTLDDSAMGGDTEEVDVTELVNMTKNIKNDIEASKGENSAVLQKMDDAFSKLADLETKLAQMDEVLMKIDELGAKIETIKPATPQEKLEMRSLDSYPFNQKPNDFFSMKQVEMQASGKNEYVLTKNDIQNYSKDEIAKTFNPQEDGTQY